MRILRSIVYSGIYGGLLMPFFVVPLTIHTLAFPKMIAFQIIIGLTFPAYVMVAWIKRDYRPKMSPLYLALVAYMIAVGISVAFASAPFRSFWGAEERMGGFLSLLHFFAWLTMMACFLKTWDQWRRLLHVQTGLSVIMAISAMLPNFSIIVNDGRATGLAGNALFLAVYCLFNVYFAAFLFVRSRGVRARILYFLVIVLNIAAIILTGSRGPFIALFVGATSGVVIYIIFGNRDSINMREFSTPLILAVVCTLFFVVGGTLFSQSTIFARLANLSAGSETRLIIWDIAWEGFLRHPILGWGYDNFHVLFRSLYDTRSFRFGWTEIQVDRAHNNVLDVLSATGLLGLTTFLLIHLVSFYSIWSASRQKKLDWLSASVIAAAVVSYLIQSLTLFDNHISYLMCSIIFALLISITDTEESADKHERKSLLNKRIFWRFAVFESAFFVLIFFTSLAPYQSSYCFAKSLRKLGSKEGWQNAYDAANIWTPYLSERVVFGGGKLINLAQTKQLNKVGGWQGWAKLIERDIQDQMNRCPADTTAYFYQTKMLQALAPNGNKSLLQAKQQMQKLIQTSPAFPYFQYGLADIYIALGNYKNAQKAYQNICSFDAQNGTAQWDYGKFLAYKMGDKLDGAKKIVSSQKVAYPYQPQTIKEFIMLVDAYTLLQDIEGLHSVVERLSRRKKVLLSSLKEYYRLAKRYDTLGMIAERNQIVEIARKVQEEGRVTSNL